MLLTAPNTQIIMAYLGTPRPHHIVRRSVDLTVSLQKFTFLMSHTFGGVKMQNFDLALYFDSPSVEVPETLIIGC